MPMLRKTLNLQQVPSTAVMTATALGIYDVTVNGMPVSQHELKPGWTDYRKEVTSQCIDISGALRKGENVICVQLSRGWWAGDINRGGYGAHLPLMFRANIEVDGKILAQTDTTWQCSTDGPLLLGDIYLGEYYDARRLHPTWHAAKVTTVSAMPNVLPFEGPDVRIRDKQLWRHPHTITIYCDTISTGTTYGHIKPLRILGNKSFTLHRGETAVIDLRQNMVGWMWFDAKAKQGTEMTLRHGEMLNYNGDANRLDQGPGGSVWTYNLRTADALLKYVFRGEKRGEKYRPHHTFMGFRYVSITATDDVEIRRLVGQVVGSDIKEWGEFECSDASVNQLYKNIWWGQRGNFLSVPTDCPQRDERLGWTGDTQIFSRTALYQSDVSDFYRKWMRDMRNSQREDGAYPDIAPYVKFWGFGTAAWGDAGVIVPWNVYDMTGDKTILVENYESMTRWMQWLSHQQETVGSTTYRHIGAGTATGDWLAYEELEPRYVAVAYYAYVAQLMDSIATALGKTDDALHYRHLYQDIREEFQQRYLTQDGQLTQTTQTAYLLALHLDLLPLQHRKAANAALRRKIEQNGYKLSTGFVGTGMLCTTSANDIKKLLGKDFSIQAYVNPNSSQMNGNGTAYVLVDELFRGSGKVFLAFGAFSYLRSENQKPSVVVNRGSCIHVLQSSIQCHNQSHSTIDLFRGFLFVDLQVPGRISPHEGIVHIPPKNRMPAMVQLSFQHQAHQFFRRWTHIPKTLTKWHHSKSVILQGLDHHGSIPAVVGDLSDVEPFSQLQDELLDRPIVNDIAFRGMDEPLPFPFVIHHVIPTDTQLHGFFREPEVRHNDVLFLVIPRWEYQNQSRQVTRAGKVKPRIARASFQFILVDFSPVFIPFVHGHPADGLFHPLVQAKLTEHILVCRRLLRLPESVPDFVNGNCLIQGGICFIPVLFICPIRVIRQAENHRVEPGIILPAFDDIDSLLVDFPADAIPIRSGSCQEKPQRLFPGVATALGHNII